MSKRTYVDKGNKIKNNFKIKDVIPWTDKQHLLMSVLENRQNKCCFITGPAGTSKTLVAVKSALELLNAKKISKIIYSRAAVESAHKSIGLLPGEVEAKLNPYCQPLYDKAQELLYQQDIKNLTEKEHIEIAPVNFMRGRSFSDSVIILDEAQNTYFDELQTIISRIGEQSRIWILGDPMQSDLKANKDFTTFMNIFDTERSRDFGIQKFEFTKDDIVRSEFCKFVIGEIEEYQKSNN